MSRVYIDGSSYQVIPDPGGREMKGGLMIHNLAFTGPRGREFVQRVRDNELLGDDMFHTLETYDGLNEEIMFIGPYIFDEGCVRCKLIFRSPYQ